MSKAKLCPYCSGNGIGNDGVRQYSCWYCDGFGFIDELTSKKSEEVELDE